MDLVSLETIQHLAHTYGYWAVCVGILLENAGLPIPGETITLVGGFLAGSGELSYWWVLSGAITGAIVGDNIGYWIGFYGGWPLLLRLSQVFQISEDTLNQVRERFKQSAAKAVIIGRFIALLRIFAGPLAGMVRMPYPKFLLYNAIGAIAWATLMTSLAFFVGQLISLEFLILNVSRFAVVLLIAVSLWIGFTIWSETRPKQLE